MKIKIGSRVLLKGDDRPGTVTEIWNGKRAHVAWDSGLDAWIPLRSLTNVELPLQPR